MNKESFELQLCLLGLSPKAGQNSDEIFEKYQSTEKEFGELSFVMADLWKYLDVQKLNLDWDEVEYKPNDALQRRTIQLAETVINKLNRTYPTNADFKLDADWNHLVNHGKLGLMSILFSIEKEDSNVTIEKIAPIIEVFMVKIEQLFEDLIGHQHREAITKALSLKDDGSDFKTFLKGRLQPFTMMRGVYLEDGVKDLKPLQWWVQNERYIPNLPEA